MYQQYLQIFTKVCQIVLEFIKQTVKKETAWPKVTWEQKCTYLLHKKEHWVREKIIKVTAVAIVKNY